MIRTFLELLPSESQTQLRVYGVWSATSALLRAAATLMLIPLVAALFGGNPEEAWPWVGVIALTTVTGWFIDKLAANLAFNLGFSLLENAQEKAANRLSSVELNWFNQKNSATARQAIAAIGPDMVGLVVYLFTPLIASVLVPLFVAVGMLFVAWPLGLAALIFLPALVGTYFAAASFSRKAEQKAEVTNEELSFSLLEFARTQATLRASRRVEGENSRVAGVLEKQHRAMLGLVSAQVPGQFLFMVVSQLALFTMVGMSVYLTASGEISAPMGVALLVASVRYMEPLSVLAMLAPGIETITLTLRRLSTVLSAPVHELGSLTFAPEGAPRISLRGVSYAYRSGDREMPVIRDLDLDLKEGETTAVVGPSGSGKSTLLKLVAGLIEPTAGAVVLDSDVRLTDLDQKSREDLISVVFQEPYLFEGTLRDNVLLGKPDADQDELEDAASRARLLSVLEQVPGGWSARIGEGGATLSGGERQRVSIARALISKAPILLLDEATSALDPENEVALMDAVRSDGGRRTQLLVTHSLKTVECADRVLFMEDGQIVEDGTVSELLDKAGRFAEFWHQQSQVGKWHLGGAGNGEPLVPVHN